MCQLAKIIIFNYIFEIQKYKMCILFTVLNLFVFMIYGSIRKKMKKSSSAPLILSTFPDLHSFRQHYFQAGVIATFFRLEPEPLFSDWSRSHLCLGWSQSRSRLFLGWSWSRNRLFLRWSWSRSRSHILLGRSRSRVFWVELEPGLFYAGAGARTAFFRLELEPTFFQAGAGAAFLFWTGVGLLFLQAGAGAGAAFSGCSRSRVLIQAGARAAGSAPLVLSMIPDLHSFNYILIYGCTCTFWLL